MPGGGAPVREHDVAVLGGFDARAVVAEMLEDALRDVREGMGASYGIHAAYETRAAGGSVAALVAKPEP